MNKKKIVLRIVLLLWEIAAVILFYAILGTKWASRYKKIELFVIAIGTLPICILIHELIHYFVIRMFSHDKVSFGFGRKDRIRCFYVHTDAKLKTWQWIFVKMAPTIVLTVIPTIIMLLTDYRSMFAFCLVMLNFAASYLDFNDTLQLCKNKALQNVCT